MKVLLDASGKCKNDSPSIRFGTTLHKLLKLFSPTPPPHFPNYLVFQRDQLTGGVRRHCRDEGVPWPAPRSLHAPWRRCRERRGWASLPAAAYLEDRGPGADEGGDGPRDCCGPVRAQLIVLHGAGFQVYSH